MRKCRWLGCGLALIASAAAADVANVTSGPELDYQAAVIRSTGDDARIVVFERLDPEQSLQLVIDHDPKPLRLQLQSRHGERCNWEYLEEGPDVWRVRLRLAKCRTGRTCGRSGQKSADAWPQLA